MIHQAERRPFLLLHCLKFFLSTGWQQDWQQGLNPVAIPQRVNMLPSIVTDNSFSSMHGLPTTYLLPNHQEDEVKMRRGIFRFLFVRVNVTNVNNTPFSLSLVAMSFSSTTDLLPASLMKHNNSKGENQNGYLKETRLMFIMFSNLSYSFYQRWKLTTPSKWTLYFT